MRSEVISTTTAQAARCFPRREAALNPANVQVTEDQRMRILAKIMDQSPTVNKE